MDDQPLHHRPLQPQDAELIVAFVQSAQELISCFPEASHPLMPGAFLAESRQGHSPMVALAGDRVVGHASFIKVREKLFCVLGHLVVDPAFRRKGVASYLVRTMAGIAVNQYEARFVKASCFSHDTPAYQMLHAMGFRPDSMVPRTTAQGETVLLVNMILRQPASQG